jgi:signal transduction histidine kinase
VFTPAPSLSGLGELVDLMRGAGLEVSLTVGSGRAPSPGVDLTAYRIVQEALTNALRHAPGSAATVTVAYEADCLTVEVTNTARRIAASAPPAPLAPGLGGGYGLAGIAERVASCGGSLGLGPGRDGSFTVTARLPLT